MSEPKVHPLMAEHEITIVPGVYDVLSAHMARAVGFRGAVLTGYGVAASYLGEPDFGLLTQTEILETLNGWIETGDLDARLVTLESEHSMLTAAGPSS